MQIIKNASFAGNYTLQAGGGSSGYGGSVVMYGHSHATKPGYVELGLSASSGGKFVVSNAASGTGTSLLTLSQSGQLNLYAVSTYASNSLALAAGLVAGDIYKSATGVLSIVY